MKSVFGLMAIFISGSLLAFNVEIANVKGIDQISCTGYGDLNKSGYVIGDYQVNADSLENVELTFKVRFYHCSEDNGQFFLERAPVGKRLSKSAATSIDKDQNIITNNYFTKIKSVEFYATKNVDEVLTHSAVDEDQVTLNIDLTQLLSDDQIINSINGETQFAKVLVSPRPLVELFDANGKFIDRNNSMWQSIQLILKMDMIAPGLTIE